MRSSERSDALRLIADLTPIVITLTPSAVEKLHEFQPGYPSGGFDGGRSGGSDEDGGRTAALALKGRDRFTRDLHLLDAALELIRDGLKEAHRVCLTATVHEAQDEALPACRSCARVKDYKGTPVYSPVHGHNLCQFCGRWLNSHGAWPPVEIVDRHHRGQRISELDVARALGRTG